MYKWTDVLRRLAGTAAVVALLGFFLYLGTRYLAEELAGGQYWLAIALAMPLAALLGRYLLDGVREGELPIGRSLFSRARQPFQYWFSMVWFSAVTVLLTGLASMRRPTCLGATFECRRPHPGGAAYEVRSAGRRAGLPVCGQSGMDGRRSAAGKPFQPARDGRGHRGTNRFGQTERRHPPYADGRGVVGIESRGITGIERGLL